MRSEPLAAGGLFEVCIGVRDVEAAARFWRCFGYREVARASLDPGLAGGLYRHASAATSVRLQASADHGLVRLWQWQAPANAGLGLRGLRCDGNRWTGQFTRSLLKVANHADTARAAGAEIRTSALQFIDMGRAYAHLFGGRTPEAFADELISLREYQVFQPESRQVFLERFGYDSPLLGTFDDASLLQTTQVVQGCMMLRSDDPDIFAFYEEVLGLWRSFEHEVPYVEAQASREAFELVEGETHWNVDLDEPASKPGMKERRSGRLKCFRFPADSPMEDVHELASPGALGMSNYTWRVIDLPSARERAVRFGAAEVTEIQPDEFGAPSFSCRAPDRYFWTFIQA